MDWRERRTHAPLCGRVGRACTGCLPRLYQPHRARTTAGDPFSPDRVRGRRRSGRFRLGRQHGTAWWQYHWFCPFRIRDRREMARPAQRNGASRDAGGGPARRHYCRRDRSVCRNPSSRADRDGAERDRPGRCRRGRASRNGICAQLKRGAGRYRKSVRGKSP